ncbi:oxidoreductase [Nocardioides deserti]|uniref:FAD-dependent oxidoreductase n=1 Tax=Nocardioides deserti TaxID=1588644 RepID=A0ABR6UD47_9ACTN|nr:FAD-dependent oxidoreductase [Nocardioides deserti]MBC2961736.1 FAD-dependent oxidoreductase [Nocardioides deserti]
MPASGPRTPLAALTPTLVGGIPLRNRVVFPGHTTNFGVSSLPTDRHRDYLARRARGGAALVISEAIRVHPTSAGRDSTLGSYHPDAVRAFTAVVDAVHAEGAATFAQVMHAGRQASGDSARTAAWAPSPIPWTFGGPVPHAMTRADIGVVVEAFSAAARRMWQAGFDGLEVHLGHGHLLQQFLSPATNTRTDEYGGDLKGRLRFAREVLAAVRDAVPSEFPVGLRVSGEEFLPGGLDLEATVDAVARLAEDGAPSFLHVSHSAYVGTASLSTQIADMSHGPAPFRHLPRRFRAAFPGIPVIGVCRIDDIEVASDLVRSGDADLVAMARAQIADPDLVLKAASGRAHETRSCLACNQACIGRIELNLPLSCVVNPTAGEEAAHAAALSRAEAAPARSVLVVGAGPAGLEAAVTAARAGAAVVLLEREQEVGGQVRSARRLHGRSRLGLLVDDLEAEAHRRGVDVRVGTSLGDAGAPDPSDFDHVVVATGSMSRVRPLPGPAQVVGAETAVALLADPGLAGRVVAVVDDEGGWVAAAIAESLAVAGARVHVVSGGAGLFPRVTLYSRLGLVDRLAGYRVATHVLRRPVRSTSEGLVVADVVGGQEQLLAGVDLVVDLPSRAAVDSVHDVLQDRGLASRLRVVGDAQAPRTLTEATHEARTTVLGLLDPGPECPADATPARPSA